MSSESEDDSDVSTMGTINAELLREPLNSNDKRGLTQMIMNKDNIQHSPDTQRFNRLFTLASLN